MGMNRKRYLAFFVGLVAALFALAFPRLLHATAEAQYAFDDSDRLTLNVADGGIATTQRAASGKGSCLEENADAGRSVYPFQSDDFNTCTLDTELWTFTNPLTDASLAMSGTHVLISVPAGADHDIWGTTPGNFKNNSARIMQPAENTDFELEVKFDSGFTQLYQMQGVLIEEDANDLLRLEFFRDVVKTKIFAASVDDGVFSDIGGWGSDIPGAGNVAPLYMRVQREGNLWTQSYSTDTVRWNTYVTFTHVMTVKAVGTYAGNTALTPGQEPAHTASIDYFFDIAAPIVPEDAVTNTLAANVVGNGQVTKVPDKTNYTCGEVVTLTATAAPWWNFGGWSGDLSGSASSATLTVAGPHVVTATFTQNDHTLTVNKVGSGSVVAEPNLGHYHPGDVVTLTATANPGWTFAGWSGDLISTDNPVTTTIVGNTVVTATFTQNHYTLTVNIVGQGSVAVKPTPGPYHYGDGVTLTATVNPGWTFVGWSGDLTGINNPAKVTIIDNTTVTATFTQDHYALTVNPVGSGLVTVEPSPGPYHYGDVVTLTATASPHWNFAGWSGGLSGINNPARLTITCTTAVTATFTPDVHPLTISTVGSGRVIVEPPSGPYHYGDVITLTATPNLGWIFAGWGGDLSGTDNPETVTMTGPVNVTATFTSHQVFLPLVIRQY